MHCALLKFLQYLFNFHLDQLKRIRKYEPNRICFPLNAILSRPLKVIEIEIEICVQHKTVCNSRWTQAQTPDSRLVNTWIHVLQTGTQDNINQIQSVSWLKFWCHQETHQPAIVLFCFVLLCFALFCFVLLCLAFCFLGCLT